MVATTTNTRGREAMGEKDRQSRIEKLKTQVRNLPGGELLMGLGAGLDSEAAEVFWRHVLECEQEPNGTRFAQLEDAGIALPAADSLDDVMVHRKLWEVIRKLAEFGVYLNHTDHLSDRDLYATLWGDLLRQEDVILPPNPRSACYLDILGGCSEEDIELTHKYYSDEEEREMWRKEFPNDPIPDHENPPHNRDRHLPKWAFG
ncbi:MAG: hypothetical protein HN341_02855 [Verrucomicrobia bacterium]|jgi:hypothetical protein|nr:hypothetical protein [Verrucomicrobiota bacterium]